MTEGGLRLPFFFGKHMHILDKISLGKIVQIREVILKAQAEGKKVYRLESGDPNFDTSAEVQEAIKTALTQGKTHYIPNNGIPELRKALKTKLETKNKIKDLTNENIFVTNGAMHALYVTFQCLLGPGDEVLIPDPMWTEVADNIRLSGATVVGVPLSFESGYAYLAKNIEKQITKNTKALFINTPHNPTGAVLSKNEITDLINLAIKHNLYIVSDEAYEDVIFEGEHYSVAALAPANYQSKIISIFSFSKSHAMSGLRVGYIATTNKDLMDRIPKLLRCTINGVNSLAQWAALAATTSPHAVEHTEMMKKEYIKRRDILSSALKQIKGIKVFNPKGTFFLWCEVEDSLLQKLKLKNVDELSIMLADAGIGNAPGDCFGDSCANAIRFAFSCATPMVEEGAKELIKKLS